MATADGGAVDAAAFRGAMARLGAAVHLITTDGPGGRAGFTASAVCSVTDAPPTLLVCLNRGASVHAAFAANDVLCVNTLADAHEPLSRRFGGTNAVVQRFDETGWEVLATGSPVLDGAIASFDCTIDRRIDVGTHQVMICTVVALGAGGEGPGLFYFDRRYHRIG